MKKITNFTARLTSLSLLLCSLVMNNAFAQTPTIIAASVPDTAIATGTSHSYINCALIDYTANCPLCSGPNQLKAIVVSDDPSGMPVNGQLIVSDGVTSNNYPFNGLTGDVIVGNSYDHFSTDYFVAVVYALQNPNLCGYDIFLNVYDFQNIGSSLGFTLAAGFPKTYQMNNGAYNAINYGGGGGTANAYPHIDIMPEYSTAGTGFPNASNFVVSFVDPNHYVLNSSCNAITPLVTNDQWGVNLVPFTLDDHHYILQAYPFTTYSLGITASWYNHTVPVSHHEDDITTSAWATTTYADVSLTEIDDSSNTAISPPDYVAFYTFTDGSSYLYTTSYDFNYASPWTLPLSYIASGGWGTRPRIGAEKNYAYNYNFNTPNLPAFLTVDDISGHIFAYSGVYPATALDYSCYLGGSLPFDQSPVVKFGTQTTYAVGSSHMNALANYKFLTQFGTSGTGLPGGSDYYQVNYASIAPGSSQNVAVNSTCNNDGNFYPYPAPYVLACWSNNNIIYEKIEQSVTYWKPGRTSAVQSINTNSNWKLAPNPATDIISLYEPASGNKNACYKVTDILGRELLNANINSDKEDIVIDKLASGMYIMHVYVDGLEQKAMKFVKE